MSSTAKKSDLQQLQRSESLRWFEGASSPKSAAIAAGFELKGNRGSALSLARKMVSLAGLGAVGGDAFCMLARGGVGTLQGFDFDQYELESWLTQPADAADAGRLKAEVQAERAFAASAGGRVLTAVGFAQDMPWWVLRKSDLLLVAGDNLEVLVWAGNMACALGIPLLQGAVHGETWTAFVRAYDFRDPETPCPACAFGRADWANQKSRQGCDPGTMRAQGIESTRTLPNVCRTAADLLSSEAVKTLQGIDGRLVNEELAYCLLSHRTMRTHLERNPDCRCPHERWNLFDFDGSPTETTLAVLAGTMERQRSLDGLRVRGELSWVSFSLCTKCDRKVPVRQFGQAGMALGECSCGETLRATPLGVRSVIPKDDLNAVADLPLAELRLPLGAAIGMEDATGAGAPTWFFIGPPPELRAEQLQHSAAMSAADESNLRIAK
jgi:molybdopterin/thiamine biosynthesis adenylyltransferase